ncbi:hypothetical protein SAMN05216317_10775 [Nitrosomonas eutropha]|uniref:Uncharacterized protein n=1 Tax=Nitrosomonas eutropha TaxID=916 RepID=A0ABX5MA20_9PROT|nr:hypothetical protein C8R14_10378 [Nitrosomonas eutropha]SCX17665.1 hypothetical protein SAMN05216379_11175 [Nitrosomonas eutropha]SDW54919.1 hypothetical protein SAMN05216317_10775 [Nitrosomonas eutropha]SEI55146.1 hypothetical protein SAMN05216318_10578 [Nitrosomonas eutropha]
MVVNRTALHKLSQMIAKLQMNLVSRLHSNLNNPDRFALKYNCAVDLGHDLIKEGLLIETDKKKHNLRTPYAHH